MKHNYVFESKKMLLVVQWIRIKRGDFARLLGRMRMRGIFSLLIAVSLRYLMLVLALLNFHKPSADWRVASRERAASRGKVL